MGPRASDSDHDAEAARAGSLLAMATGAVFFVFYLRRLCPTLTLDGDSAELVTAAVVWGVPHAPGYPLFTAIGHLFASLGPGVADLAWRVHLTSAIFHAGAVGATVACSLRISRSRLAAVAAGCVLGLGRSFLLGSLYAEVFPLNDLFLAVLLLLAMDLRARASSPPRLAPCVGFAACTSLAAAHHMMLALALPSLGILAFRPLAGCVRADRRRALALGAAFLFPFLASYALIPLAAARDPVVSSGDVHDLRSLLALVTRQDYGGLLSSVHGAGHGSGFQRLTALGSLLVRSFGVASLAAAALGAVELLRRQRAVGAALVLAALLSGPVFAWMNALDTSTEEALAYFERFTTMCGVPIALAVGAGVAVAVRAVDGAAARRPLRIVGALLGAAWLVQSFLRVREVDLHHDERGLAFAHDLVLGTPDGSLLLLSGDAPGSAALYVCEVEHLCGARTALSPGALFMPWSMTQLRRRHPEIAIPWSSGPALKRTHELAAAQPPTRPIFVYPDLLEKDPRLAQAFDALPDHLLFRLWPRGTDPVVLRDAVLASARAMTTGDGCRGCVLPPPSDHPAQEMQLVHAYEAAAINHASVAAQLAR